MKKILGTLVLIFLLVNHPPIDSKAETSKIGVTSFNLEKEILIIDSLSNKQDSLKVVIIKNTVRKQQRILLKD
jgi:hypothetical protein